MWSKYHILPHRSSSLSSRLLCQTEQDTSQQHSQKFGWERLLDILIFILVIFTLFVCVRAWDTCMYRWLCEQLCTCGDQRSTSMHQFSPLESVPGIEFRLSVLHNKSEFPSAPSWWPLYPHLWKPKALGRGFEKWAEGEAAWWVEGFTQLQQKYFRTRKRQWRQENCGCSKDTALFILTWRHVS